MKDGIFTEHFAFWIPRLPEPIRSHHDNLAFFQIGFPVFPVTAIGVDAQSHADTPQLLEGIGTRVVKYGGFVPGTHPAKVALCRVNHQIKKGHKAARFINVVRQLSIDVRHHVGEIAGQSASLSEKTSASGHQQR